MSVPIFYINRDCDANRRLHIEQEFARLRIEGVRVPGVEGRSVPAWLERYYDESLTPGEVGCSASHLTAYAIIRDMELPYAVVLEDDAGLSDDFLQTVIDAVGLTPSGWDIIRLVRPNSSSLQIIAKTSTNRSLVRYIKIPVGAAGLIISASGARKLLEPRLIKEAIDAEIRHPWQLALNVFGIAPAVVTPVNAPDMPSTISVRSRSRASSPLAIRVNRIIFNLRTLGFGEYVKATIAPRPQA